MAMSPRRIKVVSAVILAAALGVWYCGVRVKDELGDEGSGDWRYGLELVKLRTILDFQERALRPIHEDTLSTQQQLADSLVVHDKYTKAEKELRLLIARRRQAVGPEHLSMFEVQRFLVQMLYRKGEIDQAEKEVRALIASKEHELGAEGADILYDRICLGFLLSEQGKHAEAEKEYLAILATQERDRSLKEPTLFYFFAGLATCVEAQGKLLEALEFTKRAESGYQKYQETGPQSETPYTADRKRIEGKLKALQANETVK